MRTVYDEDGAVFALKCFEADEDDETLAVETLAVPHDRGDTSVSPSSWST